MNILIFSPINNISNCDFLSYGLRTNETDKREYLNFIIVSLKSVSYVFIFLQIGEHIGFHGCNTSGRCVNFTIDRQCC